jgi:DNA ligase-1
VDRLTITNSTLEKREILARHPDLAPLLAWIYDPLRQFHVSSSNILKYAQARTGQQDNDAVGMSVQYDTLPKLLSALSTRAITGHSALDAILHFMERFCQGDGGSSTDGASVSGKKKSSKSASPTPLLSTPRSKLFLKILDKNLKTGCSVAMIKGVYPDLIPSFYVALGYSLSMVDARSLFGVDGSGPPNGRKNSTKTDAAAGEGWFASRKLDGVRCLIRIDRSTGGIETLSRNGKGFESLESIQTALRNVMTRSNGHSQSAGSWDGFFARVMGLDPSDPKTADVLPEQLIFDGEMCAFLKETEPEQKITTNGDDGNRDAVVIGGRGNDELGQEHFLKTVSLVKRGWSETDESETVVYCIFDCLTGKEFRDRKGTRPFSERLQGVARALYEDSEGEDDPSAKLLRILKQTKLKTFEQLEKMVTMGMERGWEGVMVRKDIGYEGKRR